MVAGNTRIQPALGRGRRRRRSRRPPARRGAGVARRPVAPPARSPCSARSARHPYDRVALSSRLLGAVDGREVDLTLGDGSLWREAGVVVPARDARGRGRHRPQDRPARLRRGARVRRPGARDRFVRHGPADPRRGRPAGSTAPSTTSTRSSPRSPPSPGRTGRAANVAVVGGGLLGLEAAGGAPRRSAHRATIVHSGRWLMSRAARRGRRPGARPDHRGAGHRAPTRRPALRSRHRAERSRARARLRRRQRRGGRPRRLLDRHHPARRAGPGCGPRARPARRRRDRRRLPHVGRPPSGPSARSRASTASASASSRRRTRWPRSSPTASWAARRTFPGIDDATKLKLSGVDVASFGDALARQRGCARGRLRRPGPRPVPEDRRQRRREDPARRDVRRRRDARTSRCVRSSAGSCRASPRSYLAASGAEPPAGLSLPDDAQVCSCNNVSVGRDPRADPRRARRGLHRPRRAEDLLPRRNAVRLVRAARQEDPRDRAHERRHRGVAGALRALRAEPERAVRVGAHPGAPHGRQVFERFGTGLGCDICKPVVASVLATQTSAYILDGGAGPLQDTNDRALANMQKDGTYSVVPRIPAGEITPAQAQGDRRGGRAVRPLHEDHRRPADRHVRRATRAAARDLADPRRRRVRVRPGLRQVAAQREVVRRLDVVPLRRAGLGRRWRSSSRSGTGACARRTSSRWGSRDAPASARRPAARTSA